MNRILFSLMIASFLVLGGCFDPSGESAGQQEPGTGAESHRDEGHADNGEAHEGEGHAEDGEAHEGEGHAEDGEAHADEEAQGGESGHVELTRSQLERLDIDLGDVRSGTAGDLVSAPATLKYNADLIARVGPRLDAKIVEVIADLGQPVAPGDPLAVLDSVALGKAKARHLTTKARVDTVRANFERQKRLNENQIVSEAELLEARARLAEARAEHDAADEELKLYGMTPEQIDAVQPDTDQPLSRYVLRSPIEGVVQHRDAVPGQTISANETPFLVVDTASMWLMIQVAESDLAGLQPGQRVDLRLRSYPDRIFSGTLNWLSTQLDEETRTARVRAVIDNPDGTLRDGMFGTASIQVESGSPVALVPTDAVQRLGQRDVVFAPGEKEGEYRAVPVTTGAENAGYVEIIDGLEPGATIVVSGAFDLMSALTASTRSAAHSH